MICHLSFFVNRELGQGGSLEVSKTRYDGQKI